MLAQLIVALAVGVVGGAVGMFFVARNNKKKFITALGMDFNQMVDELLSKTEVDEKVMAFINELKSKFK